MNKEKQLLSDIRNGIKDIITDPSINDDLEWLKREIERVQMYLDVSKLHWKSLGEGFFIDFISLLQKKSSLCSRIDKQLFPERAGEDDIELFLVGAYSPHPHCTKQSTKFREILKSTLKRIWPVVSADIFRISRVYFLDGPAAMCQPLTPGCGELLFDLYFTEGIFVAGDVQSTICHEISHTLLEPIQDFDEVEPMAEGVCRYLMADIKKEKKRK